jgi:four helix bundle protein
MNTTEFSFEKLTVYQRSLQLSYKIYTISQKWPREHLFGITDQLRRAIVSISLNIAEGYSRSRKDFQHFLTISRGSCFECIPLIKMAANLQLISNTEEAMLYNELLEISRMLSGLRASLTKNNT